MITPRTRPDRTGPAADRQPEGSVISVDIVFETHSTTEDNETGRATGWLPGRLSAAGREQARQLGLRRANDGLDAIFTSDLARALETVEIAFDDSEIPLLHDWRLRECDYGALNGGPVVDLDRPDHIDVPYPSGESWLEAIARVGRFLHDLEPRWADRRVLVIGHTATRWAFDHLIDGVPIEDLVAAPFSWQEGWEYRLRAPSQLETRAQDAPTIGATPGSG